ncbi:MAG: hypothetical protein K9N35_09970 [Candidatus Marinimicrobia bacterium]|nr:hypothetical protein [Candidatus Neomarinimicrobiota bacterium]
MIFTENEIESANLMKPNVLYRIILESLCGKNTNVCPITADQETIKEAIASCLGPDAYEMEVLTKFAEKLNSSEINYATLSELLLSLEKNRINQGFFDYFFLSKDISKEKTYTSPKIGEVEFKKGVMKFRGYALLRFGNIKYGFSTLRLMDFSQIEDSLLPYSKKTKKLQQQFVKRPAHLIKPEIIAREKTVYNGEITGGNLKGDIKILEEAIGKGDISEPRKKVLEGILQETENAAKEMFATRKLAKKNTDVYLTQDYMDIYIATSMRETNEFFEMYDFIHDLFSKKILQDLNIRYFDPTQSFTQNRTDKGLLEGLILKRCLCTIYMVQNYDTMGKDSELATTLVQGKPVIAYIPTYGDKQKRIDQLKTYPVKYLYMTYFLFKQKSIFEKYHNKLEKFKNAEELFEKFHELVTSNKYTLLEKSELPQKEFIEKNEKLFEDLFEITAICEDAMAENRASTLRDLHPLGIQINLQTGVANGVMVVRTVDDCAKLLERILLNTMCFEICDDRDKQNKILKEEISESAYRVITSYNRLTNSFWNHYQEV